MISNSEIEKRIQDSYELENNVLKAVPKPMVTVALLPISMLHSLNSA